MSGCEWFVELMWSNVLVAGGIACLASLAPKLRAPSSVAHALWVLVLLKLVTPPWFETRFEQPGWIALEPAQGVVAHERFEPTLAMLAARGRLLIPQAQDGSAGSVDAPIGSLTARRSHPGRRPVDEPAREMPSSAGPPSPRAAVVAPTLLDRVVLIEIVGAAIFALWTLLRLLRFRRVLRTVRPAGERLRCRTDELAQRLGLRRSPSIEVVPARISPMVWSLFSRPRILVPEQLVRRLDRDALDTLLIHELAHVRRGDHWTRHLELLVGVLHWWNPLVWWATLRLRLAEEECCDAWVVWALPHGRRRYADALLGTVEYLNETRFTLPAAASGMGHVDDLKRRLTMIMQGKARRALSTPARIAMLALAGITLSWMPAFAQQEAPRARDPILESRLAEEVSSRLAEERAHTAAVRAEMERLNDRLSASRETASRELEAAKVALADAARILGRRVPRSPTAPQPLASPRPPTDSADEALIASLKAAISALAEKGESDHVRRLSRHLARCAESHSHGGMFPEVVALYETPEADDRISAQLQDIKAVYPDAPRPQARHRTDVIEEHRMRELEARHAAEMNRVEQKVDELAAMVQRLIETQQQDPRAGRARASSGSGRGAR